MDFSLFRSLVGQFRCSDDGQNDRQCRPTAQRLARILNPIPDEIQFLPTNDSASETVTADFAHRRKPPSKAYQKMPLSSQIVLDEHNDRAALMSSAENTGGSCRYSSHEHDGNRFLNV